MAFATRIKTWIAGEALTASDLNTEISIPINALSDGTKDANLAAVTASSVAVSGQLTASANANVAGNVNVTGNVVAGGIIAAPATLEIGDVRNLAITLSGGLLSLTQANGAALSTGASAGYIGMPSTTAGKSVVIAVTAPIYIQDAANASSHLTNTEFGVTAGADWASDLPFFIYAVNRGNAAVDGTDGNSAIFLSRNPTLATSPSNSANVASAGSNPSTDDYKACVLLRSATTAYTSANYTSLPCTLIGAVRMRYATATHDWTVQTLGNTDGIGQSQLNKTFATEWTFPTGQNGASSSTHVQASGGVAPVFTTQTYKYKISRTGNIHCEIYLNGDGGTDGSGGVGNTKVSMPYPAINTLYHSVLHAVMQNGAYVGVFPPLLGAGLTYFEIGRFIYDNTGFGYSASVTIGNFLAGSRTISGTLVYNAYSTT